MPPKRTTTRASKRTTFRTIHASLLRPPLHHPHRRLRRRLMSRVPQSRQNVFVTFHILRNSTPRLSNPLQRDKDPPLLPPRFRISLRSPSCTRASLTVDLDPTATATATSTAKRHSFQPFAPSLLTSPLLTSPSLPPAQSQWDRREAPSMLALMAPQHFQTSPLRPPNIFVPSLPSLLLPLETETIVVSRSTRMKMKMKMKTRFAMLFAISVINPLHLHSPPLLPLLLSSFLSHPPLPPRPQTSLRLAPFPSLPSLFERFLSCSTPTRPFACFEVSFHDLEFFASIH